MIRLHLPHDVTREELDQLHGEMIATPFRDFHSPNWFVWIHNEENTGRLDVIGKHLNCKWRYDAKAKEFYLIRIENHDNNRRVSAWRERLLNFRRGMADA